MGSLVNSNSIENTFSYMLHGQHYLNTKTRQRHYKKTIDQPLSIMSIDAKILDKVLVSQIL